MANSTSHSPTSHSSQSAAVSGATHGEVSKTASPGTGSQQGIAARNRPDAQVLRPAVDIYETAEGITLEADMPGVSRERLEVHVDGETLLLEGSVQFALPEGADALYADVRSTTYRRAFQLSRELEPDKIQANLKDGVLQVHIPKRAELRPRRIEVLPS